ncbi:transcriptional regulator [Spirillospora sp. NPDC046719]
MVITPLTDEQRDRGRALGQVLRAARGPRTAPAFFTVASLARVLDLDLTALAARLEPFSESERTDEPAAAS